MSLDYQFTNLCGTVHKGGNVIFTPDGNSLLSAVGNRVTHFDLVNHATRTLPFETRSDIDRMAVSPNGLLLLIVDRDGYAVLCNLPRRVALKRFNFKARVHDVKFSPNGRFLAVTHQKLVQVWRTPGQDKKFVSFSLYRRLVGHTTPVSCLDWSHDSRFIVAGGQDATARIFSLDPIPGFRPFILGAHRERIMYCAFAHESHDVYTISRDGTLLHWHSFDETVQIPARRFNYKARLHARGGAVRARLMRPTENSDDESDLDAADLDEQTAHDAQQDDADSGSGSDHESDAESPSNSGTDQSGSGSEEGDSAGDSSENDEEAKTVAVALPRWRTSAADRHYFMQHHAKVTCAVLHKPSSILTVGFTNGVFALYEVPEFSNIHSLSVSQKRITSVAVNATGEWLALASSKLGQLLVWEWQSESYILKQQGHFYDSNVVAFSPNGQLMASGGDDGKVKLWNTSTGFCVVTFKEHLAGVTGLVFVQSGLAVLSASLDGTVRAFDTTRYRNFRTMTSPHPSQFGSLATDASGELVCAGCLETFEIFVWSLQTGKLVDVISGHEGPVSALAFHPTEATLISTSWDKSIKLWSLYDNQNARETVELGSDAVALAMSPIGSEIAVSTLNGILSFFSVPELISKGTLEIRRDLRLGRSTADKVSSTQLRAGKTFSSLCFTPDGEFLLAGGQSKFVCLYHGRNKVLLKQFALSSNLSMDAMLKRLNSKYDSEAGNLMEIDDDESGSDLEERVNFNLPGVKKGDLSSRRTRPEIRCKAVSFAPSGRSFVAATTEGLVLFSIDDSEIFDPFDLDIDVTPENVRAALDRGDVLSGLVLSFRLNDAELIRAAVEATRVEDIPALAQNLSQFYLKPMLELLARQLEKSRHLDFYLHWTLALLNHHGRHVRDNAPRYRPAIRDVQKALSIQSQQLGDLMERNRFSLAFLSSD